uniref:Annexin n=2 Tax=Parascaris TaxID=6254 RepID=A0A915C1L8_PARUN
MYYESFYGTIREQRDFDPNQTAEELKAAMHGFGCDKEKVIDQIVRINNAQRQMVAQQYVTLYGKDLIHKLKKELHGDLEDVIVGLMETPPMYDVIQLHKAIHGLGTKNKVLIEILCSRTNSEIWAIRNLYEEKYGESLEDAVKGDTSGHFEHLLVSLLQGNRDDQSYYVDAEKAKEDAQKLFDDGESKIGTDESTFNAILISQNLRQLDRVFYEYEKISGHTIEEAIESEFSGHTKKGLLALVRCIESKPKYFAYGLNKAMEGMGTRDKDLIRIIISRSEIDLGLIKKKFEEEFGVSLVDRIRSDCSGAYQDALVKIVEGNH